MGELADTFSLVGNDGNVSHAVLSAVKLVENDYERAMEQLLAIMRQDRGLRDDIGRNGPLAIFGILNNKGPLVERYRSLMVDDLH